MNVEYLIQMLDNKLLVLNNAKTQSYLAGDLDMLNKLDEEILGVQNTIYKLRLLLDASLAATAVNTTVSAVMTANTEAVQNSPANLDATLCLDVYDISSYATDPLHEQKIRNILEKMGALDSIEKIHEYIHNAAPSSPLTGQMVFNAALKYNIHIQILLAIMELDSYYGTLGVAASTMNPGNVGNTGSSSRAYASWQDGVEAVADWLNRHRKNPQPTDQIIPGPVWLTEAPLSEVTPPPVNPEPVIPPIENPTPEPIPEPQIPEPEIEPIIENPATTTPEIISEPEIEIPLEPPEEIILEENSTSTSTPIAANIKTKGKKYLAKKRTRKLG